MKTDPGGGLSSGDERRDALPEGGFERAIQAAGHAIYITDPDGTITYVNPAFEDITGYTAEDAFGQTPAILQSGEQSDEYYARLWETLLAGEVWEEEVINQRKGGEHYTAHQTIAPITSDGTIDGFAAIQTDITERQRQKERLHQYERAIESGHDLICATDHNDRYLFANPKYRAFHDIEATTDVTELTLADVFDTESFQRIKRHIDQALQGADTRYQMTRTHPTQGERTFDIQYDPLDDGSDEIQGVVATMRDITDLVERTEALERNREFLAQTERLAEVGGWQLDLDTNILQWTPGTRRLHEVPPSYEPTLAAAETFYHPADRETVAQAVERCREDGVPYDLEARLITAEGRTRWVRTTGERATHGGRTVLQGAIRDITSQKRRDQRLSVLNRVLRHNLRNNLTTILGYTDLLEDDLTTLTELERGFEQFESFDGETGLTRTRKIKESARTLFEIAEKAQTIEQSVSDTDITEVVDVTAVIDEVVATYRDEYPDATITVRRTDASVHGNQATLRRIIDELLENALKHAEQDAPTVTICVELASAERVTLHIEDTGPGLPELERQTIEEGIETPLMHASGIGLWLVNWLVMELDGTITISENNPTGTIVSIELPGTRVE